MRAEDWRTLILQLCAAGHLEIDAARYGALTIAPTGRDVLFGRATFERRKPTLKAARPAARTRQVYEAPEPSEADAPLFAALKKRRTELARELGVAAYVIFPDRTLHEMAARKPATLERLAGIHGVGAAKLEKFGAIFLQALTEAGSGDAGSGDAPPEEPPPEEPPPEAPPPEDPWTDAWEPDFG